MKGCKPLSDAELSRVLGMATLPRERALFLLGVRTGLRVSELLSLRVRDVMQYGSVLDSLYIAKRNTKGSTEGRAIPMHPEAAEAIQALVKAENLDGEAFLFKSRKGYNKALGVPQAWRIIKELFARAEIGGHVATHTMRKTFADRIHNAMGRDIFQTQRALGHKSLDNTASYLSFDQARLHAAIKSLK